MRKTPRETTPRKYFHSDDARSLDAYLKQIGKTPLISVDEEVRLARRIKLGDQKALNKMTEANMRFVVTVAKGYQNQGLSLSDLIDEGSIGLIKAAKRFDETRGFKFISYAVWWIRQAILQALAEQSRIVRLPLNRVGTLHTVTKTAARLEQELGRSPSDLEIADAVNLEDAEVRHTMTIANTHMSLDATLPTADDTSLMEQLVDTKSTAPDERLRQEQLTIEVRKLLDVLTPREVIVVDLYHGLTNGRPQTLEEIGGQLKLTRERVRQIHEKALRKLRFASRKANLRKYLR